jgi:hypothetical protein
VGQNVGQKIEAPSLSLRLTRLTFESKPVPPKPVRPKPLISNHLTCTERLT